MIFRARIRFVFLLALLLLPVQSFAQLAAQGNVRWMNYDEALSKAKEAPRLILVDMYADWCIPCRYMDEVVYSNAAVANLLNARFYPVKLDTEKDAKKKIMCDGKKVTVDKCHRDIWRLKALPSLVLVAPKGMSILTLTQSMTVEEMQYLLQQFLEKEKEWISQ